MKHTRIPCGCGEPGCATCKIEEEIGFRRPFIQRCLRAVADGTPFSLVHAETIDINNNALYILSHGKSSSCLPDAEVINALIASHGINEENVEFLDGILEWHGSHRKGSCWGIVAKIYDKVPQELKAELLFSCQPEHPEPCNQ